MADAEADPSDPEDIIANIGSITSPIFLALHPFGRLATEAQPEDPANWKVVGYEILARSRGGGDDCIFGQDRWCPSLCSVQSPTS